MTDRRWPDVVAMYGAPFPDTFDPAQPAPTPVVPHPLPGTATLPFRPVALDPGPTRAEFQSAIESIRAQLREIESAIVEARHPSPLRRLFVVVTGRETSSKDGDFFTADVEGVKHLRRDEVRAIDAALRLSLPLTEIAHELAAGRDVVLRTVKETP